MEFIPMYVDEPQNKEPGDIIKNTDWNNLFNLLMTQGNYNTDALLEITQTYPTTVQMEAAIAEQIVEIGAGDMAKAVYDTDNDGIVDMAETVVDGGITTDKIADQAINENKLSEFLLNYITNTYTTASAKARVKFGKISDLTPSSTEQGATDEYTTTNVYKTYNIGFTPTAVIIFCIDKAKRTNYSDIYVPTFHKINDSSTVDKFYYGGLVYPEQSIYSVALNGSNSQEIFRKVSSGFRTHEYRWYRTGSYATYEIDFSNSYYLAIG